MGTLRGQDIGKGIVLGMIVIGTLLATAGVMLGAEWPSFMLDLLKDLK